MAVQTPAVAMMQTPPNIAARDKSGSRPSLRFKTLEQIGGKLGLHLAAHLR
jgi:hypothetical protein